MLRDDDSRHLVVQPKRELVAAHVEDPDEERDRARPAEPVEERLEVDKVEEHLRHRELGACLELRLETLELELEVVGRRVDGDAEEEDGGRVDLAAVVVLARVHPRDHLREPDRVDVVDALRSRVIASLGRVAGDGEHVANALRVRAEQHRLETGDRGVARGEVRDRLEPDDALDRRRGDEAAHPRSRARVVVDVDDVDVPRGLESVRQLEHRLCVSARGGSISTETTNSPGVELPLQQGLLRRLGRPHDELALAHDESRARTALLVDGGADRCDLGRGRAAAAADDPGAELAGVRRELREVLGCRMREDHAVAGEAREPDVRQHRKGLAGSAHALERAQRSLQPDAVVRADRGDVELCEGRCGLFGGDAAERLRVLVEREQATMGSAETLRTAAIAATSSSSS